MKTNLLILLFLSNMVLMCKNDTPNTDAKTKNKTEKKSKTKDKKGTVLNAKQSADYSSLFNLKKDICLTVNEVAKATNLDIASISKGKQDNKLYCYFDIKLPKGDIMKYNYTAMNYENHSIKKEIKNLEKDKEFKKKNLGMYTELSETGDTYIVHSRLRNEIRIMNTNYSVIILTNYGYVQDKLSKEQKKIRDEYATKIANYLLHKHKK